MIPFLIGIPAVLAVVFRSSGMKKSGDTSSTQAPV